MLIYYRFQWVVCQLDVLKECTCPHELNSALNDLPETLDETYKRILRKISRQHREKALLILHWMILVPDHHVQPKFSTLADISGVDRKCRQYDEEQCLRTPQQLLKICGSLIKFEPSIEVESGPLYDPCVEFSHKPVQEFFLADRISDPDLKIFNISERLASQMLVTACCLYLSRFDGLKEDRLTNTDWSAKARGFPQVFEVWENMLVFAYQRKQIKEDTANDCYMLFESGSIYRVIGQYCLYRKWPLQYTTEVWPKLHVATQLGLDHTCRLLLEKKSVTDCAIPGFGTALHVATHRENAVMVRSLLEYGVNVDAIDLEREETPLVWSVSGIGRPKSTVTDILLDARPRLQLGTAFVRAAGLGDMKLIKRLLDLVGHPDAPCTREGWKTDGSALEQAAHKVDNRMMRFLIASGANIDLELRPNQFANNVMSGALQYRFKSCETLLSKGGSILYSLQILEKWQQQILCQCEKDKPLYGRKLQDPPRLETLLKWLRKYNLVEYVILRHWLDDKILRILEVEDSEAPSPILSWKEVKNIVDHEEGETAKVISARFLSMVKKRCELVEGLDGNEIDKFIIIEVNESENITMESLQKIDFDESEDTKSDESVDIDIDEVESAFGSPGEET